MSLNAAAVKGTQVSCSSSDVFFSVSCLLCVCFVAQPNYSFPCSWHFLLPHQIAHTSSVMSGLVSERMNRCQSEFPGSSCLRESVDRCSLKFSDLLCNSAKSSFITCDCDFACMVNVSGDTESLSSTPVYLPLQILSPSDLIRLVYLVVLFR